MKILELGNLFTVWYLCLHYKEEEFWNDFLTDSSIHGTLVGVLWDRSLAGFGLFFKIGGRPGAIAAG